MKYLFVIASYSDYRQKIFDEIISPRNEEYCAKHNYKYVVIKDTPNYREHPSWDKYFIISDLIDSGKLKDNDYIAYIDADQYFVKIDYDICPLPFKSVSLAIDSGNTFCHSWNGIRINEWSRKHVKNMIDNGMYLRQTNNYTIHPKFPQQGETSFFRSHFEQAAFYSLCGIKRHSDVPFLELPNEGFHSEVTEETKYSLEEIKTHIDIFPTRYNVTEWEGESGCMFNINKVNKEDVVIRHFAGGQDWNNIKNWI